MWGDEDVQPIIDEAHEKLAEGDLNAAYELFQRACNRNPDAAEAHYGIGLVWFKREDYHRARQCLGRALTLDPGMHKAQDLMSQCDQHMRHTTPSASTSAAPDDDIFGGDDLTTTTTASTYKPAKRKGGGGGAFAGLAWAGIIIFGVILVALGGWFAFDNFVGGGDIKPTDISGKPQILVPGGLDDKGKMTFKTAEKVDESQPSISRQPIQPRETTGTETGTETGEGMDTSDTSMDTGWDEVTSATGEDSGLGEWGSGTVTITDENGTRTIEMTSEEFKPGLLFYLGAVIFGIASILGLILGIWLLIVSLQKGIIHFIGVLCCSIYALIFMFFIYDGESKSSIILLWIIGTVLSIVGIILLFFGGIMAYL